MGGNTEEIHIGSERELYKYINHYAVETKASSKIYFSTGVKVHYICTDNYY